MFNVFLILIQDFFNIEGPSIYDVHYKNIPKIQGAFSPLKTKIIQKPICTVSCCVESNPPIGTDLVLYGFMSISYTGHPFQKFVKMLSHFFSRLLHFPMLQ